MATRSVLPIRSDPRNPGRLPRALASALVIEAYASTADSALAKTPPLATTVLETDAPAAPDHDAAPVALVSQGAQIELTGAAAPGFLSFYYDGQAVWVPVQYPSLGVRPNIDTGVTIAETPLLDASMLDASVVEIIHEGRGVILAGARVDGYDSAEYDGAGGWVDERDLSR